MSQNVFSITDNNIPIKNDDFILIDTNVIIDITGYRNSTHPRTIEVKNFINDMAENNSIFVIPTKAWEEMNIILESSIIGNKHKDPNEDLGALTYNVNTTLSNLKNALNTFPNIYTEPIGSIDSTTLAKAEENRDKYGLKWGDATIVAIAQQENIKNILTFDYDYTKVNDPNINILLNSSLYNKYTNETSQNIINPVNNV